jgi:hypothetical protein
MVIELEDALDWEPIPLSIEAVSAPDIDQDRTEVWPEVMAAGEALNVAITGAVLEQATVSKGVRVTVPGLGAEKVA